MIHSIAAIENTLEELDPVKARALANDLDKMIWAEGFDPSADQSPGDVAVRSSLANFGAAGLADLDYTAIGFTRVEPPPQPVRNRQDALGDGRGSERFPQQPHLRAWRERVQRRCLCGKAIQVATPNRVGTGERHGFTEIQRAVCHVGQAQEHCIRQ